MRHHRSRGVLLVWKWGQAESDIRVAGDFSDWVPWRLTWYHQTGDHRVHLPSTKVVGRDRIEFKFLLNGVWTCDGTISMCDDGEGNINNYMLLAPSNRQSTPSITPRINEQMDQSVSRDIDLSVIVDPPPAILKLRKQLTSSDKPSQDGIVIRTVRRELPLPAKRTYGN